LPEALNYIHFFTLDFGNGSIKKDGWLPNIPFRWGAGTEEERLKKGFKKNIEKVVVPEGKVRKR